MEGQYTNKKENAAKKLKQCLTKTHTWNELQKNEKQTIAIAMCGYCIGDDETASKEVK